VTVVPEGGTAQQLEEIVPTSDEYGFPLAVQAQGAALCALSAREARRFYGEVLGLPLVAAFSGEDWGGRSGLMMAYGLANSH
jgi:hypothetical protein